MIWLWIVIGIVVAIVAFITIFWFATPFPYDRRYPTDTPQANRQALGLLLLHSVDCLWNDPTASAFAKDPETSELVKHNWGIEGADDVYDTIERLVRTRRQNPLWQQLMLARAAAAQQIGGKRPSQAQWLEAIRQAGGTGEGPELQFVQATHHFEELLSKRCRRILDEDHPMLSTDAYGLGKAVAMCVWSVHWGYLTQEESQAIIRNINDIARAEFDSWEAFGRSYVVYCALFWTDADIADEENLDLATRDAMTLADALGSRHAPWDKLPWSIVPAAARQPQPSGRS